MTRQNLKVLLILGSVSAVLTFLPHISSLHRMRHMALDCLIYSQRNYCTVSDCVLGLAGGCRGELAILNTQLRCGPGHKRCSTCSPTSFARALLLYCAIVRNRISLFGKCIRTEANIQPPSNGAAGKENFAFVLQVTEAVVDVALRAGVPFAVVPCCVFPKLFPDRRIEDGRPVITYDDFIEYLQHKGRAHGKVVEKATLKFAGSNTVLFTRT